MTVIRVRAQKDFTVLFNVVLENPNLSFKAKGLWAYCMSRPDNWQFHVNHLATISKDGPDAIYSALKELEKEGLVEKTQSNEKGKFGPVDYVIYPYPPEFKKCLPHRDFPETENPLPGNPALVRTDIHKKRTSTKKEGGESPPPPQKSPPLLEKGKFVRLSPEDFRILCNEYGNALIEKAIEEMNDYLSSTGKKSYKDYAAAIRNWIRKEQKWNENRKESSWKKNKSPPKSENYNPTSSDKAMEEQILVPLSSIMNTQCASNPGSKKEKEPSS